MFGISKPKIITDIVAINSILERGVENIFPSKDFLKSRMVKGEQITLYYGIDPTGPTLHIGHLVPIRKLAQFQKLGHKIIFLIGDFTATIGDPTDKSATRKVLTKEEVQHNLKEYKKQASHFISFDGSNSASFKFNSEWLGKMNFSDVLSLASEITVQQMLERDMFAKRMEEGKPIHVHEFLYPLMQGYDSVAMDVDGEIGGNDQTFNMLVGRDLMKSLKNKEKFVIATKLLTDSDGKKMGKTENNMVALNQTPEDMFGRVMSWSDGMIIPAFEITTDVSMEEIAQMKESLSSGGNPRDLKIRLAREIVALCSGIESAKKAEESFNTTFSKGGIPNDVLEVMFVNGTPLVDILISEKIVDSKSEWRRLVSEGAVTDMTTEDKVSNPLFLIHTTTTYKIGKRRFIKVTVK